MGRLECSWLSVRLDCVAACGKMARSGRSFKTTTYFSFSLSLLQDCPKESGDFRAQQCSAHNDMNYQGQVHEWVPVLNDPVSPCALKCQARGKSLVLELAPKVLDGTRCRTDSFDMCISGICQVMQCIKNIADIYSAI